jgi:hypothetical protein
MENSVRAANDDQRQGNVNNLVTPEMRQQLRELEYALDECDYNLSRHLQLFDDIREGLDRARLSARCLLTRDPFEAWEKVARQREEEWEAIFGISTADKRDTRGKVKATANVEKLITRQMRQQIVEAKKQLDDYVSCLCEFFDDVKKLQSLDTALDLAEDLQCREPLETWDARKKRREEAAAAGDEDPLDEF